MTETPDPAPDVQRALMDRARRSAERDNEPTHRAVLPRLAGVLLALLVVLVVLFAKRGLAGLLPGGGRNE